MRILKFGGTSLANPDRVRAACDIIRAAPGTTRVTVVVSAFAGVTDRLVDLASAAIGGVDATKNELASLAALHRNALADLAPADAAAAAELDARLAELESLLQGVGLVAELSPHAHDRALALGETFSATIVAAALRGQGSAAEALDPAQLILTAPGGGTGAVDAATSYKRIREHFLTLGAGAPMQIVMGCIGSDTDGRKTTLGRGGSDLTASLLGAALAAEAVELWTDVDGVMSADPRMVPEAIPLRSLSYVELAELSHFGAKVVHPPCVHPTRLAGIPLFIRNSAHPNRAGTEIRTETAGGENPVKGIASISDVALLRLEGDGMVGIPGIAMRLFGALARRRVSVILISQASSEHSICFAVAPIHLGDTRAAVAEEFELERHVGRIDDLIVEEHRSVVAVVGAGMRHRAGLAGRLFSTLGAHGVNVHAIAQGSSELNVSVVVAREDEARAVNALHDAFFLAGVRTADVFIAGVGGVGGELLRQIAARHKQLLTRDGLRIRVRGVANSRGALVHPAGLDPEQAAERLRAEPSPALLDEQLQAFAREPGAQRVFVDCTANAAVAENYGTLLGAGVTVVTANKLRLAGELAAYRPLRAARPGRIYFETTVGAGLPVLRTLEELLATGDTLLRIEGVFSGTISFIMAQVLGGAPFSTAVREAFEKGYTEPDPRQDLGGLDVARKLVILCRVAGEDATLDSVQLEPLMEAEPDAPLDAFWAALPAHDRAFAHRVEVARERNKRLGYVASAENGELRVGFQELEPDHACANLRPGDNVFVLQTDRYHGNPLVIRGPGAGREVTAAGVFADLLRAVAEGST